MPLRVSHTHLVELDRVLPAGLLIDMMTERNVVSLIGESQDPLRFLRLVQRGKEESAEAMPEAVP